MQEQHIQQKLDAYFNLLWQWNRRYHLVGKSITREKIVSQCTQMLEAAKSECGLSKDSLVLDIGSGAGLPGILWSILEGAQVCIVELSHNRCSFLRFCAQQLSIPVQVECSDIRKFSWPAALRNKAQNNLIITAQAFASIRDILDFTKHFRSDSAKLVLLKSAKVPQELAIAEETYTFSYKTTPCEHGNILTIENVKDKLKD